VVTLLVFRHQFWILSGSLLKIEASEKVKIETINLLDISGRRVWKQKFASTDASTLFSLTLPNLSSGSYLVEILVDGSKKAVLEKLIVQ
jgi:Secretion system C-terminal sorting domain